MQATMDSYENLYPKKQVYKIHTLEVLFCKNSTALLAELLKFQRKFKILITYSNQSFIPPCKEFRVINISRHGKEYKGFINHYRLIE